MKPDMSDSPLTRSLVLGSGGAQPGAALFGGQEAGLLGLLDLPLGHSIYAIDLDADAGRIALGTRGGEVKVLSVPSEPADRRAEPVPTFCQGSDLLAVCFLSGSRIAAADVGGNCLVWWPGESCEEPEAWPTEDRCVCALRRLPEGRVAGLCAGGGLLVWEERTGRLLDARPSPAPEAGPALAVLRYWPGHDVIVYPAHGGYLAIWQPLSGQFDTWLAHNGGCCALMVDAARLWTVGTEDALLKAWEAPSDSPCAQYAAPLGVIAGQVHPGHEGRFLLVNDLGEAGIGEIDSDSLRMARIFPGSHYRTVAAIPALQREEIRQTKRRQEARELLAQVENGISAGGRGEDLDGLHQRLAELGFKSVALGLLARAAAGREDTVSEIDIRRRLCRSLPQGDPGAAEAILTLARLLGRVWQPAEALAVCERAGLGANGDREIAHWRKLADLLAGEDWIVQAATPIPVLLEAATLLERPFTGLWVADALEAQPFVEGTLRAEALVAKYEEIRQERIHQQLPGARASEVWWISDRTVQRHVTVLFADDPEAAPALLPAVHIQDGPGGSEFVPVMIFHAGLGIAPPAAREHNARASATFPAACGEDRLGLWPPKVRSAVRQALCRLQNRARSARAI